MKNKENFQNNSITIKDIYNELNYDIRKNVSNLDFFKNLEKKFIENTEINLDELKDSRNFYWFNDVLEKLLEESKKDKNLKETLVKFLFLKEVMKTYSVTNEIKDFQRQLSMEIIWKLNILRTKSKTKKDIKNLV